MLGDGSDGQASCVRNALMMGGIDGYRRPHQARQQRAFLSSDLVLGLDTVEASVRLMPGSGVEVLVQMPTVHYAQELHPPAYTEEGYVSCHGLADQCNLGGILLRVELLGRRLRLLPVAVGA